MRSRVVALVLLSLVTVVSSPTGATKRPIVPTLTDLAITWWGQLESGTFMLLELDPAGAGTLVMHGEPSGHQSGYRIRRTTLAMYDIRFEIEPVGNGVRDLVAHGKAFRGNMDLKIGAKSLSWKDKVTLRPWSQVTSALAGLKACNDRIREAAASGPARCD